MRRHLLILALCLLIGAAMNVALAWLIAAFVPAPSSTCTVGMWDPGSPWPDDIPRDRLAQSGNPSLSWRPWGARYRNVVLFGDRAPEGPVVHNVARLDTGWPRLSMTWTLHDARGPRVSQIRQEVRRTSWTGGIAVRTDPDWPCLFRLERRLPLRPLWPGFAFNTAIYAAAAWIPPTAWRPVRRRLRRGRGRCVRCGYDLKRLSGGACPECGAIAEASLPHGSA